MGTPHIQVRDGSPDFLDLPWDEPINDWDIDRLVTMPTGVHRHPVVFVAYPEGVFAVKELPRKQAHNEYRVLRQLQNFTSRSAAPAGLIERDWLDPHQEGAGVAITRYVDYSFPYRRLISGPGFGNRRTQMLDALASLLVELHIAGCYWGDCSLSNVLYRFDAGQIEAIMIDAETSRIHAELSDGQRLEDIEIMKENIAGEMMDVAVEMGADTETADIDLGSDVAARYERLWSELTSDLVVTKDDTYRIRERIGRINDLGFSVDDVELTPADGGRLVKMSVHVGGRTYNSDSLAQRVGIEASENQAKSILGDLNYHLAKHSRPSRTGKSVATFDWLTSVFEPLLERIEKSWHGDDPVQGYCDYLNYRIRLANERKIDIDPFEAFDEWERDGYPGFEPEP